MEFEAIYVIVNNGFSEAVMTAAKAAGARGGTVFSAHGTGRAEAEKFYGITISPEKEIVLILVPKSIRNNVMKAIYTEIGLGTPGEGIAFSLPATDVIGLAIDSDMLTEKKDTEPHGNDE